MHVQTFCPAQVDDFIQLNQLNFYTDLCVLTLYVQIIETVNISAGVLHQAMSGSGILPIVDPSPILGQTL